MNLELYESNLYPPLTFSFFLTQHLVIEKIKSEREP